MRSCNLFGFGVILCLSFMVGCSIAPAAAARSINCVPNPGFEAVNAGVPADWHWDAGAAKGKLTIDTTVTHSGRYVVRIDNGTAMAPNVYCSLSTVIHLMPGTIYTLSCYVRSANAGHAWIGGGPDWKLRLPLPSTVNEWRRVSTTFTTTADADNWRLLIVSESPTSGIWIDDVQVEPGSRATPFQSNAPLPPGQARLAVLPAAVCRNLLPNPSFEEWDDIRPHGWMWDKRNTDATMTRDTTIVHSGKASIHFTNGTAFHPQVYGWFGIVGGVSVKPNTTYTLSCWARSNDPGTAWIGGGPDWTIRERIPPTGGDWVRVVRTFTTGTETSWPLMFVSESPTSGIWLDDMKLEQGAEATPFLDTGTNDLRVEIAPTKPASVMVRGRAVVPLWKPDLYPPGAHFFTAAEFQADGFLYVPNDLPHARIEVRLLNANGAVLATQSDAQELKTGAYRVAFDYGAGNMKDGHVDLQLRLLSGDAEVGRADRAIELHTAASAEDRLRAIEQRLPDLDRRLAELKKDGRDAYLRVIRTVLVNFIGYAREDLRRGEVARGWDAARVMTAMLDTGMKASYPFEAPRYVTSPIRIDGPAMIATAQWPNGRHEQRPIQFVGYGHFNQVRHDVEKFPDYGCNLIQIEFGPNSVLPTEDSFNDTAINDFIEVCQRAAKAGVGVNLLLSPHYFPAWAMKKWPFLADCNGGFLHYCVHAPESRSVLEKFLRHVIPKIKDLPALHSLCLSNEPINVDEQKCRYVPEEWRAWLRKRHGDLATLNRRWGTNYKSWDDISVPPPSFTATPRTVDFIAFNEEIFAAFHRWMADVIHSMAPNIPVHAKIMMGAFFGRSLGGPWSVDPELFGQLSQINGNDDVRWPDKRGEWNSEWQTETMGYDFQRSVADKPVFNSENHFIPDRDTEDVAPVYVRNVLWQGAVHGQSSTTLWAWERTFDPTSDFNGLIMHRPACAAEVGLTALDLNRLSPQITALQRLAPRVVLLWSYPSLVLDDDYPLQVSRSYQALDFCALPIGFVTERQLSAWTASTPPFPLRAAKVILVPSAKQVSAATLAGLRKFQAQGGKVVCIGDCLTADEYGQPRSDRFTPDAQWKPVEDAHIFCTQTLLPQLRAWGCLPPVQLTGKDGQPVWGVETRVAEVAGKTVVNLSNFLNDPQTVSLTRNGKLLHGTDLITGGKVGTSFTVEPLRPMLVEVE